MLDEAGVFTPPYPYTVHPWTGRGSSAQRGTVFLFRAYVESLGGRDCSAAEKARVPASRCSSFAHAMAVRRPFASEPSDGRF
eukprot:SAG31_NODE_1156_length_9616_cov_26.963014_2_plen_82_part_00